MKIVALEEHFATAEVMQGWKSVDSRWSDLALKPSTEGEGARRLLDLGAERLDAMNEAGIDVAVLSVTTPGVQLDAEVAVDLARSSNDHLAPAVHITPERFQGFATLPTPSPDRAAKELVRCIRELDLHGAMLHGRTRDQNLSEQEFGPIFEAAEALGFHFTCTRNHHSRACWTHTTKGSARTSTLCLRARGLAGITKPEFRSSA